MLIFKLLVFMLILSLMSVAGIVCYKWLNKKIISSNTLLSVVGYACLLVSLNLLILFGGIYSLLLSYELLFK